VNVHPVDARTILMPGPSAAEERDLVSAPRDPTENLVQMNLGATCLWIFNVLPIHEQ
jgi:hypothetical protein